MLEDPRVEYHVRHARAEDFDAILGLRQHAEKWLKASGIEQWTDSKKGEQSIRDQINAGVTYAVQTAAGDIVGCLTLDAADPDFWSPVEASQPALYLYKFIIRSDRRRTGLGDLLLDWACERAEDTGARWLRLDCWKTNTGLHRYYENRGFRHLDTRNASGRASGALFERPAEVKLTVDPKVVLIDDTQPHLAHKLPQFDRYDPSGEALIWHRAAESIQELIEQGPPDGVNSIIDPWTEALRKASDRLAVHSKQIRQANGMYYRVISGKGA